MSQPTEASGPSPIRRLETTEPAFSKEGGPLPRPLPEAEELREGNRWLRATLQSIGEAVIAADDSGRVLLMNRVAEELTGCREVDSGGRRVDEIVDLLQPDGKPFEWVLPTTPGGKRFEQVERILVSRAGVRVPVSFFAAPICDERGAAVGAVVVLRDISARKRVEEQLQHANQELHQFVRSASHDLQEPLRMISLYCDLIQRDLNGASPDTQEYLRYVIGGAERMTALLADLRSYAEITGPEISPPETTDAELILQMVLANLTAAIEQSGAVIAHDPLPIVAVHRAHLTQLFQNLISNAVKYRREEPLSVHIAATPEGRWWRFSCTDNGQGIPPEYWDRVFHFFQRLHDASIPGTGMGLAICRRIVQRYGGRIWVESTPGRGSGFYFTLPSGLA